ncbi:hypothetical protein ACXYMO_14585 [Arenibacterium sp. CAU 1754]
MKLIRVLVILAFAGAAVSVGAGTERSVFIDMARKGWVYELRSAMWRRDPDRPPVRINGRDMAGAALCVVGERPHFQTARVLETFSALMTQTFGKPVPMRYGGTDLSGCGTGRIVYLRLYSGRTPHRAFNDDLRKMDAVYGIGLPANRDQYVMSPAQAQTFFGRYGRTTHLLVKQAAAAVPTPLEQRFFTSILIEELYQSFTFGMDILHFDRHAAFLSKLEEMPLNLRNLPWDSTQFMEGLLRSNPGGLCPFDVFMLHALAHSPLEQSNTPDFLGFIETEFDDLLRRTNVTVAQVGLAPILDPACTGAN